MYLSSIPPPILSWSSIKVNTFNTFEIRRQIVMTHASFWCLCSFVRVSLHVSFVFVQAATDALSRYDQIIVTARIVLMFDGSSGQSRAIREAVPLFQQVYKIIRAKCPQWHEGNVQLMGVYLAITFLEYGLNSQTLGVDGQSTTLDWVHGLQPDDLEKFLAEKKEQRMRVLCLDLEPTGIPQQVWLRVLCNRRFFLTVIVGLQQD